MLTSQPGTGSLLAGDSREYRLGPVLAEGGEGIVYFVDGRDDVVAKLYKEAEYGRDAKLRGLIGMSSKRLRRVAAWPLSSLFDAGDNAVGFVMESLEEWEPLHAAYQIRTRLRKSPHHSWAFLVRVARNLATCVHHVHEQGLVVGDLNESNVLVGPDAMVKLIDADSFQVRLDGRLYPCKVAKPELLAPELQGMSLEGTERTPDQDRFALAVLIFQTLLFGRHPFAGRPTNDAEVTLEGAIKQGWYVMSERPGIPVGPPPHLTLDGLSPTIRELFERAFDPAQPVRPSGREWYVALRELEGLLRTCPINGSHVYWNGEKKCPWCGLEEHWNITLFRPAPSDPLSAADFDVDGIWNLVSAVPEPAVDLRPMPANYRDAVPAPLSPWHRFVVRPIKLVACDNAFWLTYAAILFARPLADAGPVGEVVFAIGLFAVLATAFHVGRLRRRIRVANRKLAEIEREWAESADPKLFEDRRAVYAFERNALAANQTRYEAARQERIRELHRPDLVRFLQKYTIMAADAGIDGRARLAQYKDKGIETAADMTPENFAKHREFEASVTAGLIEWRRRLEEQFWNATSYGLPPHEERVILERIYREDVGMRRDLREAEPELRLLADRLRQKQMELLGRAAPYQEAIQRNGSILVSLERRRG